MLQNLVGTWLESEKVLFALDRFGNKDAELTGLFPDVIHNCHNERNFSHLCGKIWTPSAEYGKYKAVKLTPECVELWEKVTML